MLVGGIFGAIHFFFAQNTFFSRFFSAEAEGESYSESEAEAEGEAEGEAEAESEAESEGEESPAKHIYALKTYLRTHAAFWEIEK